MASAGRSSIVAIGRYQSSRQKLIGGTSGDDDGQCIAESTMRSGPEATIEALFAAWRLADIETTLAYCSDAIVYELHLPDSKLRYAGEITGKEAVGRYLRDVVATWEFLQLEPGPMHVEGGLVREVTQFKSRVRTTGDILEGRKRHIWHVEFGLVTRCEEFQDTPMLRAFLGLTAKA